MNKLGKDTVVVEEKLINYSDVVTRAFFQSAGLTGVSNRVVCRPTGYAAAAGEAVGTGVTPPWPRQQRQRRLGRF